MEPADSPEAAGYVPPQRFVNLLARLERREQRQRGGTPTAGGASAAASTTEHPGSRLPQMTPSPATYERYKVSLRKAAARGIVTLRRGETPSGGSPNRSPSPAMGGGASSRSRSPSVAWTGTAFADGNEAEEEAVETPRPLSSSGWGMSGRAPSPQSAAAIVAHDAALEKHAEHRRRVVELLDAEEPMRFYGTTAEADERDRNAAPPRPEAHSNLDDIEHALGIARRRDGNSPVDPNSGAGTGDAEKTTEESPAARSTRRKSVGGKSLRVMKALESSGMERSTNLAASQRFEPAEFVAMRNKLHETEAAMEDMRADFTRKLQEAALKADLENKALRFEAEEHAAELTAALRASQQETREAVQRLQDAQKEIERLRAVERELTRTMAALEDARSAHRAAVEDAEQLRRDARDVPGRIAEGCAAAEALRDEAWAETAKAQEATEAAEAARDAARAESEDLRAQLAERGAELEASRQETAGVRDELRTAEARQSELAAALAALEAERAGFAKQAEDNVRAEIDATREDSRIKSAAYAEIREENAKLEEQVANMRGMADAYEVQRKTLKRLTRDHAALQEEAAMLRAYSDRLAERRMHHIFQNIALKLHLARVLRPNGLADRLKAAEKQNAWLMERLNDAAALAQQRLRPNKKPSRRLAEQIEGGGDVATATPAPATATNEQLPDGAALEAAAPVYVIDSATQTTAELEREEAARRAREVGGVSRGFPTVASDAAVAEAAIARLDARRLRRTADLEVRTVETSDGPGRFTPAGLVKAADDALRDITDAPVDAERERSFSGGGGNGSDGSPRAMSAAASSVAPSHLNFDMPPRAGSASASVRRRRMMRPGSAPLSHGHTAVEEDAEFLVVGQQGPPGATIAASPYDYFGTGVVNRPPSASSSRPTRPTSATAAAKAEEAGFAQGQLLLRSRPTSAASSAVQRPPSGRASPMPRDPRPQSAASVRFAEP